MLIGPEHRISATAASKGFSDLLSRVAAGESVEIERHGHVVAVVVPPQRGYLSGRSILEQLDHLPVPDPDFGSDVAGLGTVLIEPVDLWGPDRHLGSLGGRTR